MQPAQTLDRADRVLPVDRLHGQTDISSPFSSSSDAHADFRSNRTARTACHGSWCCTDDVAHPHALGVGVHAGTPEAQDAGAQR